LQFAVKHQQKILMVMNFVALKFHILVAFLAGVISLCSGHYILQTWLYIIQLFFWFKVTLFGDGDTNIELNFSLFFIEFFTIINESNA